MAQLAFKEGFVNQDQIECLPTRSGIADLQRELTEAKRTREFLYQEGQEMLDDFRTRYPDGPAYLTRYADRTLSDYRWRLSGRAKWRHAVGLTASKASFDLTNATGKQIISYLPAPARADWLQFEARRLRLNYESAIAKYRILRLNSLIEQQELLRQLAKEVQGL